MSEPLLIPNVKNLFEAAEILTRRGIKFEKIGYQVFTLDYQFGGKRYQNGNHHYFMVGETDVAYFTDFTKTLLIHPEPRQWSQENLALLKE